MPLFFPVPLRREISAPEESNANPMLRDKASEMFYVKAQMQNLGTTDTNS